MTDDLEPDVGPNAPMPPVEQIAEPLYDYGKLYSSEAPYDVCLPGSIEEVQQIMKQASAVSRQVRVRASGHTFNGCTLPRDGELLIRTRDLDWYRFEDRGTVTAGAGALVWDIRDLAGEQGFEMPVYNGGWAGPSLGGYINSGGFGKGSLSDASGGLWENVLAVTLVDAMGVRHTIDRDDDRFPWLFGSYGQLGVIVEAKLKLVQKHPAALLVYPLGQEGRIPRRQTDDPADNDRFETGQDPILFWFSLLISPEQETQAWEAMAAFCDRYDGSVVPDGGWAGPVRNGEPIGYRYNIRFHSFNPPLLYARNENFIVMGVMSFFDAAEVARRSGILEIEKDFIALAADNDFRLYLQAENIGRQIDYRAYYGDAVFAQFEALKQLLDPQQLINAGTIFAPGQATPA